MTDPDAPTRTNPKMAEWQHWLVVNIPGNKVEEGEVLRLIYSVNVQPFSRNCLHTVPNRTLIKL